MTYDNGVVPVDASVVTNAVVVVVAAETGSAATPVTVDDVATTDEDVELEVDDEPAVVELVLLELELLELELLELELLELELLELLELLSSGTNVNGTVAVGPVRGATE